MAKGTVIVVAIVAAAVGFLAGRNSATSSQRPSARVVPDAATTPDANQSGIDELMKSVRSGESPRSILLDHFNVIVDKDDLPTMMRTADEMVNQLHDGELQLRLQIKWAQCSVAKDQSDGQIGLRKYWDESVSLMRELRARRLWDEVALLSELAESLHAANDDPDGNRKRLEFFTDAMHSHREYGSSRGVGNTRDYPIRQYLNRLYSESAASAVALATDTELNELTINLIAMEHIAVRDRAKFSAVRFANTSTDEKCWDAIRLCNMLLSDKTGRFVNITDDVDGMNHVAGFSELLRGYLQRKTALWMETSLSPTGVDHRIK